VRCKGSYPRLLGIERVHRLLLVDRQSADNVSRIYAVCIPSIADITHSEGLLSTFVSLHLLKSSISNRYTDSDLNVPQWYTYHLSIAERGEHTYQDNPVKTVIQSSHPQYH